MENAEFTSGPSLPGPILYPTTILLFLFLLFVLRRKKSAVLWFAVCALWLRYVMSCFHDVTFQASPIGLSWNAVGSVLVFLIGILIVGPQYFLTRRLIPCYAIIAVVVISGFVNQRLPDTVETVVKFGYFAVLMLSVVLASIRYDAQTVSSVLLVAFAPPLVYQAISVALGVAKASENDGSVSYIGGYNHEAGFSIVLLTALMVVCLAGNLSRLLRYVLFLIVCAGVLLANYRTSVLAAAPMLIAHLSSDMVSRFSPRQRPAIALIAIVVVGVAAIGLGGYLMAGRFGDLDVILESPTSLMKPPEQYTAIEAGLLSSRPYLWSQYIYGYASGSLLQHLFGFGPNSWEGVFSHYAHNTLVSTLYEFGVVGVALFCLLWLQFFLAAAKAQRPMRMKLLAAHATFLLLNLGTMPHWMIEGDIFYGILCGYTVFYSLRTKVAIPAPARRAAGMDRTPSTTYG